MKKTICVASLMLFGCCWTALATTYYVKPALAQNGDGDCWESPWSIEKAMAEVSEGDTLERRLLWTDPVGDEVQTLWQHDVHPVRD